MPSKSRRRPLPKTYEPEKDRHVFFVPMVVLTLIVWIVYRAIFQNNFPVWFDETIGKALFFGLPVWFYVIITSSKAIPDTFSLEKLKPGLLLGVAVGGIYGFAASLLATAGRGAQVQSAALFSTDAFWWEFLMAMFTGFWESLFFYCFIMSVIQEKLRRWPLVNQVILTAGLFVIFHLPNTLLRASGTSMIFSQLILLSFFAIGQGFFFARNHNGYALTLSHAIWGMVLYVHLSPVR
jgi:hypothetical protein